MNLQLKKELLAFYMRQQEWLGEQIQWLKRDIAIEELQASEPDVSQTYSGAPIQPVCDGCNIEQAIEPKKISRFRRWWNGF